MSYFAFTSLLVILLNSLMCILIIFSRNKSKPAIIWCWLCASCCFWGIGGIIATTSASLRVSLFGWQLANICSIATPVLYFHFSSVYCNISKHKTLIFLYVIMFLLLYINFFHISIFFGSVELIFNEFYFIKWSLKNNGPLYPLFYVSFYWILLIYSTLQFVNKYHKENTLERERIKYLIISGILGFTGAHNDFITAFNHNIYPYGNILVAIFPVITAFAIIKHKIFNIDVVIKKSLAYSALILLLALLYFTIVLACEKLIQGFWGYRSISISVITAFIIGVLVFPLHNRIQQLVDRIIFKKTTEEISKENELLRAEVLKSEKLKSVAVLASGMAHEIKNPLTALKTFSEYLPQKLDDKEFLQKFSRIVGGEVNRIDQLVNELLEFAKPAPINLKLVNPNKLIIDTLDFLNSTFLQRKITVNTDLSPDCTEPIMLDPNKMRQALLNIFLNAIDAMTPGGTLTVRVIASEARPEGTSEAKAIKAERSAENRSFSAEAKAIKAERSAENRSFSAEAKAIKAERSAENRSFSAEAKQSDTKIAASPTAPRPNGTPSGREDSENKIAASPTAPRPNGTPFGRNDKETSNQPPTSNDQPPTTPTPSIIISITDTGCGIEQDQLVTIFDPFHSTKDAGTGLGLPITHGIISEHQGEIKVASIVGQGTTFTLIIPRDGKNSH